MADRWALTPVPYIEGALVLYGFTEEIDARRFAELHLPDWVARPVGKREEGHRSICGECGTKWPCAAEQVEREVSLILHQSRHACHACGKSVQGCLRVTVKGGGDLGQDLVLHGRQGKCRNAAIKLLKEQGLDDDLQRLDEEVEMRRGWSERRKAWKEENRRRLRESIAAEVLAERAEV